MKMKDYLKKSARTAAEEVYMDKVSEFYVRRKVHSAVEESKQIDAIKKTVFYNRETLAHTKHEDQYVTPGTPKILNMMSKDTLHAALGIYTEAGEILEKVFSNEGFTREELVDECGDLLWYMAMMLREIGTDFETTAGKNIDKLAVRFPEKFETSRANAKDKKAESEVFKEEE